MLEDGGVSCWGAGPNGRLGYGNTQTIGDDELPSDVAPIQLPKPAIQVATGGLHSCALVDGGEVWCWGGGEHGYLGSGNTADIGDNEPPDAAGAVALGGAALQIDSSYEHTCAVLQEGQVRCWGVGEGGRLGYGNTDDVGDDETPLAVAPVDIGGDAVAVAVGFTHSCALRTTGDVVCWGENDSGTLGYGHAEPIGDDEAPAAAGPVSLGGAVVQIAAGGLNTCALLEGGLVRCWGDNAFGQLGLGHQDIVGDDELPSAVEPIDLGGPAAQVVVGDGGQACAWMENGTVVCWGNGLLTGHGDVGGDTCFAIDLQDPCDQNMACCLGDAPGEMPPAPVQI